LKVADVNIMNKVISQNMETQNVNVHIAAEVIPQNVETQNVNIHIAADVSPQKVNPQIVNKPSSGWPKTVNINKDAHLAEMEGIRLDQVWRCHFI
jgi:hypothetical protein